MVMAFAAKLKLTMYPPLYRYEPPLFRLCLLALAIGLCVGILIVIFRLIIDAALENWLPNADHFEYLPATIRTLFIFVAGILLWCLMTWMGAANLRLSVSHVIDRLHNHQGNIPIRNWFVQFFGGIAALIGGHSVGQEGPIIHLGAGAGAKMAQALNLPVEQIRLLAAAGVAAAIGACFNTPLAGVILAMEVVLMEYSALSFLPIILAAVTGAGVGQYWLGSPSFVSHATLNSFWQIPYLLTGAIIIACASALFIHSNLWALRLHKWPLAQRLLIACSLTAMGAWYWPEIMGLGTDTLQQIFAGQLLVSSLIIIGLLKIVISPITVGLGIPGGLIGPTLLSGACFGGALGLGAQQIYGVDQIDMQLYVLLGMAAMMAATLKAPLAALIAVVELSYNPQIIFPAMLVIVLACAVHRQLFKLDGIFIEQLKYSESKMAFTLASSTTDQSSKNPN